MYNDKKFIDKAIAISTIALKTLGLKTLDTQNSDNLDFHDLSVGSIKSALYEAYESGYSQAIKDTKEKK